MTDLTLRGVTLPWGVRCDLHIRSGRWADQAAKGATIIDADELIVLPGLVDPHCHLREGAAVTQPAETIASGTAAAARGGFTTVAAMPNATPACHSPQQAQWLLDRAQTASARVVPIGAVTHDRAGQRLAHLAGLGRVGVRLFSDDGAAVASADLLAGALRAIAPFDGVVADHCQDATVAGPTAWRATDATTPDGPADAWPRAAETNIVARDIQVASETGRPVHLCHLSCAESVDMVRWAKARHVMVTAEVTPHHLYLTADQLRGADPLFKVNPPLRSAEDVAVLRAGLADGTIDMVGTDHAPHRGADKARHIELASPGMTGLEQALAIVIETMVNPGHLDWAGVADRMSYAPAALLRLGGTSIWPAAPQPWPVGAPANLVLVNPTARAVVQASNTASLARNNPYVGRSLPDPVVMTLWDGRLTYARPDALA